MRKFKYRIMVVEDEQLLRESTVGKIKCFADDFTVTAEAQNGSEALALLDRMVQLPDIVITDIVMPVMDGLAFAEALRARAPQLPIVILSGYNEFDYAKRAMSLGVREYLLKPLDDHALHAVLHRLVQELDSQNATLHQSYLYMLVNNPPNPKITELFAGRAYKLALLVAGNSMTETINADVNEFCESYWEQIALPERWRDIDEMPASVHVQKSQFPCEQVLLFDAADWEAKRLCDFLKALHAELNGQAGRLAGSLANRLPTALYFTGRSLGAGELYEQIKRIRQYHDQSHAPWTAPFRDLTNMQRAPFMSFSGSPMNMDRLATILQTMNDAALSRELRSMLASWHESAATQGEFHRKIVFFLHGLERLVRDRQIQDWQRILNDVYVLFATSPGFAAFSEEMVTLLLNDVFAQNIDHQDLGLIARIRKHIDQNYTKPISLFDLANQYQISPSYLARQFKHVYGESPSTYIILVRIEEAKRLISDYPGLDVKNIAELVGYPDQHYFSKLFKKHVGLSPTDFRTKEGTAWT